MIMNITHIRSTPARWSTRQVSHQALALTAALAVVSTCGLAQAASTPTATTAASAAATSGDTTDAVLKFSQAGHDAFDSIRMARTALSNGQPDAALKDMKAAQMSLIVAKAEAPSFATRTQTQVMGKLVATTKSSFTADAVPVGGDLVLADNFQLSEQHRPVMAQAQAHLAKGDKKAAVEVLKQGAIDVSYKRQWLPLASAEKHLDEAISAASYQHFDAAKRALQAIVDGVQTDVVRFDTVPAAS
jgi:hypothetical protein